ncbi:MAG: 2-phosphoglycerate kinase, partial [Desulfurobacterium sp.]
MAKRFVIDSSGEKYPFSKGVLVRSLTRSGLSVEEAYKVADEVASSFKGTITSETLSELVYSILRARFGKRFADRYRSIVKEGEILVAEDDGKTYVPFSRGI